MSERVKYPGFRHGYGPTHDWPKADGPFCWVRFTAPDADGMCLREAGFTDTREEARTEARA